MSGDLRGITRADPPTRKSTAIAATTAEEEDAQQRLRDFRLTVEYKYLVDHAPGGVFMLPALEDNRTLFGVIFVRRGLYRNGIFRFKVILPPLYNSHGASPQVTFTPAIFNPLVDSKSGAMQLTLSDSLLLPKQWNPEKHFLATVVTTVKKMFYIKNFDAFAAGSLANEEARALHAADPVAFQTQVDTCVQQSLEAADAEGAAGSSTQDSSIRFCAPQPAHAAIREAILGELLHQRAAELRMIRISRGATATFGESSADAELSSAATAAAAEAERAPALFNAIAAEDRLLAEEVMSALQIFRGAHGDGDGDGVFDAAAGQPWASSVLDAAARGARGGGGSNSAGRVTDQGWASTDLAGSSSSSALGSGAAVFYDISNEVEDEEDASARRT